LMIISEPGLRFTKDDVAAIRTKTGKKMAAPMDNPVPFYIRFKYPSTLVFNSKEFAVHDGPRSAS